MTTSPLESLYIPQFTDSVLDYYMYFFLLLKFPYFPAHPHCQLIILLSIYWENRISKQQQQQRFHTPHLHVFTPMSTCLHIFALLFVLRINCGPFHVRLFPPLVNQISSRNSSRSNYFLPLSQTITFFPFTLLLGSSIQTCFKKSLLSNFSL